MFITVDSCPKTESGCSEVFNFTDLALITVILVILTDVKIRILKCYKCLGLSRHCIKPLNYLVTSR